MYVPGAPDSESKSAAWIEADGRGLRLATDVSDAAARLVRATDHAARLAEPGADAALVRDIDLAILGRDALRFMEYEYGVSEEYSCMPQWKLVRGRRRFLAGILASPAIYRTPHFRERYEAKAKANLTALLGSPRYSRRWCWGW